MHGRNVGIIGGGPGGLMTAYFLQKLSAVPIRLTIFEASDRLGGKILTNKFQLVDASYEAGAAELYDYSPVDDDPLRELIEELGLPTIAMGGSTVILDDQILSNLDDIRDHLGPSALSALASFDRFAKDTMSPREFYFADQPDLVRTTAGGLRFDSILAKIGEPQARRYVENLIHSDLATEGEKTSVSYGLQNYLMNDPAYMRLYSIEGGNERLPRELARRIDAETRFEHPVTRIGRGPGGRLRVTSAPPEQPCEDEFDFVVVALPSNCLADIHFAGRRLSEAMSRHRAHYNHPAHYLRVTILFDRPFWRGQLNDSYSMLAQFGGCCLYDESSREPGATHGVLGWLMGGQAALEMSALGDAELIDRALNSLPHFLREGRRHFLEGKVHRWLDSVSALPGGTTPLPLDRRHQPEPIDHPDLFVVGDYLFDSTLNGVLDSAHYVAEWLAALLAESCGTNA